MHTVSGTYGAQIPYHIEYWTRQSNQWSPWRLRDNTLSSVLVLLPWSLFFSWCTRSTSPRHVQTRTPNAASLPMTWHSSRRIAMITPGIYQLHEKKFLQHGVDAAGRKLKDWHLLVNTTKTVVLSSSNPNTSASHSVIHSTLLQQVHQHRHLGVTLQDESICDVPNRQHIIHRNYQLLKPKTTTVVVHYMYTPTPHHTWHTLSTYYYVHDIHVHPTRSRICHAAALPAPIPHSK